MTTHPKPEPRATSKARQIRAHARDRAACRLAVYTRAQGKCEACGVPLYLLGTEAPTVFALAHIHEADYRSQGGSDTDPENAKCLCICCHGVEHGGRIAKP